MPDARPGHGTPIDREKLLSLSVGKIHPETRVTEGRVHPETGVPWKRTATDAGYHVEHATRDDRVDAVATVDTIRVVRDPASGRITNA